MCHPNYSSHVETIIPPLSTIFWCTAWRLRHKDAIYNHKENGDEEHPPKWAFTDGILTTHIDTHTLTHLINEDSASNSAPANFGHYFLYLKKKNQKNTFSRGRKDENSGSIKELQRSRPAAEEFQLREPEGLQIPNGAALNHRCRLFWPGYALVLVPTGGDISPPKQPQ